MNRVSMYAAILAGGQGKRFWPYSRQNRPKQFLDITGKGSMLSLTYQRLAEFIPPDRILILTVKGMDSLIHEEIPDIPEAHIFIEPVGRNTAPSLALAASAVLQIGGDFPILCCPSDHLIREADAFRRLITTAADVASSHDALVTFGIRPEHPATGYGYIEAGPEALMKDGQRFCKVRSFHEKPDHRKAESYLKQGDFYWNSGIFIWRPSVFLSAWSRYLPEGKEPIEKIVDAFIQGKGREAIETEYHKMPSISVDYGILEKADNVLVAPADLGWNDVGSWDALFDILEHNDDGNVISGYTEVIDSKGNLLFNPHGTTAAVGIEDLIVVVNEGTVLICKRGLSQRVRELIELMEQHGKDELL